MTVQEVMAQINSLPLEDRLELLRQLVQTLHIERGAQPRGSSIPRVRGMLRTEGLPPADGEARDAYVEHLMEKYT